MANLKIIEGADLESGDVATIQEVFTRIDARIAKLTELEVAAKQYFDELDSLGEELAELEDYSSSIVTEDDEEVYIGGDYPAVDAASAFHFWIPSSMGC